MDMTTKFDRRIDILNKTMGKPEHIVEAAVYVNDTMEMAWMIAEEIFGEKAPPAEVALGIYDRIDRERLRLVAKGTPSDDE